MRIHVAAARVFDMASGRGHRQVPSADARIIGSVAVSSIRRLNAQRGSMIRK
jgi:hypothetical protein